jgi:hypothetical protein
VCVRASVRVRPPQLYVDNELVDDTRLDEGGELLHNNSASNVVRSRPDHGECGGGRKAECCLSCKRVSASCSTTA